MDWVKKAISTNQELSIDDFIKNCQGYDLLLKLKDTIQDAIWHAEGNVYIHTNMVIKEIYSQFSSYSLTDSEKYILIMAAAFHDIAKPISTKESERNGVIRIVSPKHEYKGMSYLYYKLLSETMYEYERNAILDLVGYHQEPKLFVVKNKSEWHYRNLTQHANGKLFYILEKADMLGRVCDDLNTQLEYLEIFKLFCEEYDVYEKSNTLSSTLNQLFSETKDSEQKFLIGKAKSLLLSETIIDPLVAAKKYYSEKKSYSDVFMLCGISGSGKSTLCKDFLNSNKAQEVVSLDAIRKTIKSNDYQYINGMSRQIAKEKIKQLLAGKVDFIIDSTNYIKDYRSLLLTLVEDYNGFSNRVLFQTPIDICIKRDQERDAYVGKKIIEKQASHFEYPERCEFNND